jgi:protein-S-isoprenylcysteine O-methyltransferase Ste14
MSTLATVLVIFGSIFLFLFIMGLIFPKKVLDGIKKFNIGTIAGGNGAIFIIIIFLICLIFTFWIWLGAKISFGIKKHHQKKSLPIEDNQGFNNPSGTK